MGKSYKVSKGKTQKTTKGKRSTKIPKKIQNHLSKKTKPQNNKVFIISPSPTRESSINPSLPNSLPSSKCINSKDDLQTYYAQESIRTIKEYGKDYFLSLKEEENNFKLSQNFLSKHKLDPKKRTHLVEFILFLCKHCHYEDPVFFMTIFIIDSYLEKSKEEEISLKKLKLISLTALHISAKQEAYCIYSLKCYFDGNNSMPEISHEEIYEMEEKILFFLEYDINVISSESFLEIFFCDLLLNYAKEIKGLKLEKNVLRFQKLTSFIAKLALFNEKFYELKLSTVACCCIAASYSIIYSQQNNCEEEKEFFYKWTEGILMKISDIEQREEKEIKGVFNGIINEIYNIYENCKKTWIRKEYKEFFDLCK